MVQNILRLAAIDREFMRRDVQFFISRKGFSTSQEHLNENSPNCELNNIYLLVYVSKKTNVGAISFPLKAYYMFT